MATIIQVKHQDKQTSVTINNKWENELARSISPDDWKQMCKNIHETNSNYWREYAWKILT